MSTPLRICFALACLLTAGANYAQGGRGASNKLDQHILVNIAAASLSEIEVAKVALFKSKNPALKSFAQTMVDEHSNALEQVRQLATSKSLVLPAYLDKRRQEEIRTMGKLNGAAFDTAYVQAAVKDHQAVHDQLKIFHAQTTDTEVLMLIEKIQPTVDHHLQMAKQLK